MASLSKVAKDVEGCLRVLCRVRTTTDVVIYTCSQCAWSYRVEGDNISVWGQVAFDAHCCEDFPGDSC